MTSLYVALTITVVVVFVLAKTALVVPQKYFYLFPPKEVWLPVLKEGDAEDAGLAKVAGPNVKGPK